MFSATAFAKQPTGSRGRGPGGVTERTRPQWLRQFLLDPGSLRPRTRMPTFFPDGQSQHLHLLEGNVDAQLEAMIAYLSRLHDQPLPRSIEEARSRSYELRPAARPIVFRTFMREVGTHAIAVGFAAGAHFAFDARGVYLAQAWRGRFLDAESTWSDRFVPPVQPLGEAWVRLGEGSLAALLVDDQAAWPIDARAAGTQFLGYRLDADGVPSFVYQVGRYQVVDCTTPEPDANHGAGLIRRLEITASALVNPGDTDSLWLRPLVGHDLKWAAAPAADMEVAQANGLSVSLTPPQPAGKLRPVGDRQEWIVPLTIAPGQTVQVQLRYRW